MKRTKIFAATQFSYGDTVLGISPLHLQPLSICCAAESRETFYAEFTDYNHPVPVVEEFDKEALPHMRFLGKDEWIRMSQTTGSSTTAFAHRWLVAYRLSDWLRPFGEIDLFESECTDIPLIRDYGFWGFVSRALGESLRWNYFAPHSNAKRCLATLGEQGQPLLSNWAPYDTLWTAQALRLCYRAQEVG